MIAKGFTPETGAKGFAINAPAGLLLGCRGVGGDVVVGDGGGGQQVLRVFVVEDGLLDVGAGEGLDGLAGIPEAERDDLGVVAVDPGHHPGAAVARRPAVLAAAGRPDVGDVFRDVLGADDAAPLSGDHDCSCSAIPPRQASARAWKIERSLSLLVRAAARANSARASASLPSFSSRCPRTAGSWT